MGDSYKIEIKNGFTHLIADKGMRITKGDGIFLHEVSLANGASREGYYAVSDEEYLAIEEEKRRRIEEEDFD